MNNRERLSAILHYRDYDRLPLVHFGYWEETLEKWVREGHLTDEEIEGALDGTPKEKALSAKLGFDFNYHTTFVDRTDILSSLYPQFERTVLEEHPDGKIKVLNTYGVIEIEKPSSRSIPSEVDHVLKDRRSWEEEIKPRLQFSPERIDFDRLHTLAEEDANRDYPMGAYSGSLYGQLRNMMGIEGISYISVDDPELYDEMIDTIGDLAFRTTEAILESGIRFEFIHFWEDICYKGGPLVPPKVFAEKVGPHYRRITNLARQHGIDIASVDCDGKIDALVPIWLENGVNTMFPIEVGTWHAGIAPWREEYGRDVRGVGGMNKHLFAAGFPEIDAEIERLKPLVDLGGYIPCPDHRIPPNAEWDTVRYYCDRMRQEFG